jgi:hypothetical protein
MILNSLFLSSKKGGALSGKCVAAQVFAKLPLVVRTEWHRLDRRGMRATPLLFVVFKSSSEDCQHS